MTSTPCELHFPPCICDHHKEGTAPEIDRGEIITNELHLNLLKLVRKAFEVWITRLGVESRHFVFSDAVPVGFLSEHKESFGWKMS